VGTFGFTCAKQKRCLAGNLRLRLRLSAMLRVFTRNFFKMRWQRAQVECMNPFAADHEIKSGAVKTRFEFPGFFSSAHFYGVIYAFVCSGFERVAILQFCAPRKFAAQNFAFQRKNLRP
jgi:hypothetical protein